MNSYIKLPKYVSHNTFDLERDSFLDVEIKKKKENYLLIDKEFYENETKSFWFIDDIAKAIKRKHHKSIFALVTLDKAEGALDIYIGNTIDIKNMDYYSFTSMKIKALSKQKQTIVKKIDFLKKILNHNEGLVVYSDGASEDIIRDIFDDIEVVYEEKAFKSLLLKTKMHQKTFNILLPIFIGSIFTFAVYFLLNYQIDDHNSKLTVSYEGQKKIIEKRIAVLNKQSTSLKISIKDAEDKYKNTSLTTDELYEKE